MVIAHPVVAPQMRIVSKYSVIFSLAFSLPAWGGDYNSLGIKAFRSGDYQKAEQLYRQGLEEEQENSKLASIYRNLSVLYSAQGKDGSEFSKKADALDPPITPMYIKQKDGAVLMYNGPQAIRQQTQQQQAVEQQFQPKSGQAFTYPKKSLIDPNDFLNHPMFAGGTGGAAGLGSGRGRAGSGGVGSGGAGSGSVGSGTGFLSRSNYINSGLGANFNFGRPGFPGASPVPSGSILGGGSQFDSPLYYGPAYGGMTYSSVSPHNTFRYSDSSLIVVPVPVYGPAPLPINGMQYPAPAYNVPLIIRAPGPNIYSSTQAPDGSSTTIILRTE